MLPKKRVQWFFVFLCCCACFLVVTEKSLRGLNVNIPKRIDAYVKYIGIWGDGFLETEGNVSFSGPNDAQQINKRNMKVVNSRTAITEPTSMEASNSKIYLFSALKFSNSTNAKENSIIVTTAWYKREQMKSKQFRCCFIEADGHISSAKAKKRRKKSVNNLVRFNTIQCMCALKSASVSITRVLLVENNYPCIRDTSAFVEVETIPTRRIDGIVICAKVQYGVIEAGYLIEWFEAQRFLGIDKILCYLNKYLNVEAVKVLKYYEKIGLIKLLPFDVPENDTYPRQLSEKNKKAWTDQRISILDCQERMNEYKYGVSLDTDEILIPNKMVLKNSLKIYLKKKFLSNADVAIMHFNTMVHMKSWGPTIPDHRLFVGRQVNSTLAMLDRPKFAYRPERVIPGSCHAHSCRIKSGYKHKHMKDLSAVIHHFRSCRENWNKNSINSTLKRKGLLVNNPTGQVCYDFKRLKSDVVETLASEIQTSVLKVRSFLQV